MIKKMIKNKILLNFFNLIALGLITSCAKVEETPKPKPIPVKVKKNSVPVYPKSPAKTTGSAEFFSLETPLRCDVNWETQNLISNIPADHNLFYLERIDKGDKLPLIQVKNPINFENLTIDDTFKLLLASTGIELYAPEPPYDKITAKELSGKLSDVIDFIANTANVYYNYDAKIKRLTIKRNAKWNLHVPGPDEITLAVLDSLRGSGITNLVVDWQEKTIIFKGGKLTEEKIRSLINELNEEKTLVAFDMDVYRIYPYKKDGINWMELLKAFRKDSVKVSVRGIIGRLLVTDPNINTKTLKTFLKPRSNYVLISRGTFILPNRWQGRFDIGQCSREERLETDIQIMAEPNYTTEKGINKITTDIILRVTNGDIATYPTPFRIGNNILIIGIPTHYFVDTKETTIPANAELAVFISPRLINITE